MATLSGKVVRGDGYGKKIGFPTANLDVGDQEVPKDGVYSGFAILENLPAQAGTKYLAGIVIGPNWKVEAHLIGFSGDLYGKELTLEVNEFIRDFKNFDTEEELKMQIGKDLEKC
jgi:FAD synthase